jgi:hypothetical protein
MGGMVAVVIGISNGLFAFDGQYFGPEIVSGSIFW